MTRLTLGILLTLMWSSTLQASDQAAGPTVDLDEGLAATLAADGTLSITQDGWESPRTVLTWSWPDPVTARLGLDLPPFLGVAGEGDPGGRRGFSAAADDDNDGRTDEDRLDGADNDGDGLVDEDFAAIGHRMLAWHQEGSRSARHLEAYHWSYPALRSMLAVTVTQEGWDQREPVIIELPPEASWQTVDPICAETGADAEGTVFLAEVPATGSDPATWVGLVVLDDRPRNRSHLRLRAADHRVTVPLNRGRLTVVVSAAASPTLVVDDLLAAATLRRGMTDPISDLTVPWLPQPATLLAIDPAEVTRRELVRGAEFWLEVARAQDADLDLVQVRDEVGRRIRIGEVRWYGQDGRVSRLERVDQFPVAGELCRPLDPLGCDGPGQLVLSVAGPAPMAGGQLHLRRSDGRPVTWTVGTDPDQAGTSGLAMAADDRTEKLQLSSLLLNNYPNPFRFNTSISFQIPATVGEAFDLDDPAAPEIEPSRSMPYGSSTPLVDVSIFNLEGSRVTTLTLDRRSPGTYSVEWDGCDEQGRTVPSGAYFCKLQIENWAVTRRLIFVR